MTAMSVQPTSVPHLLAIANGCGCKGRHRCFYCGAPAAEKHSSGKYVKDSFTGRPGVVAPGSPWICEGCVLALREDAEVSLISGEVRRVPVAAMRAFSWIITRGRALAASKAHRNEIAAVCLAPPKPPFAIVLSDAGKAHLLYRGVVNHDSGRVVITLESERIGYHPGQLRDLLPIAGRIAAAAGKPTLDIVPLPVQAAVKTVARYSTGEEIVATWIRHGGAPLGRLAAWLTSKKEDCDRVYPADLP